MEHANFIVDAAVRWVVGATVGAACAVGSEHAIDGSNHGALRRAGREADRDIVKGAIELKGRRKFLVGHPKHAVGLVVRQGRPRRCLEHKLRREHNPREAKGLLGAVENRGNRSPWLQAMRLREGFADRHLSARGAS